MKFKRLYFIYLVGLLVLGFMFYRYSYLVITPPTVEYIIETQDGPKRLVVPGQYISTALMPVTGREIYAGGVVNQIALEIPYEDVREISLFEEPDRSQSWESLVIRSGINDFQPYIDSFYEYSYPAFNISEVESEFDGMTKFGPINPQPIDNTNTYYYISERFIITCIKRCTYRAVYSNEYLLYEMTFPITGLDSVEEIDDIATDLISGYLKN